MSLDWTWPDKDYNRVPYEPGTLGYIRATQIKQIAGVGCGEVSPQLFNALYRHGDEYLFNVTFNHHALLHIAFNSRWTNPRKTACWMGEGFMRVSKLLMQPCLFGHSLEATSAKITKKFLRAMDFTFRNA